jgi:hypothetical protein
MTKLEELANEIAFLNNTNMCELAAILVRDNPTRADVLETQLCTAFFDSGLVETKEKEFA